MKKGHNILLFIVLPLILISCQQKDKYNETPPSFEAEISVSSEKIINGAKSSKEDNSARNTLTYHSPFGWVIEIPESWDKIDNDPIEAADLEGRSRSLVDTSTGKYISFKKVPEVDVDGNVEAWIHKEIARRLSAEEAKNELFVNVTSEEKNTYTKYNYVIRSTSESSEYRVVYLHFIVISYDDQVFEFRTSTPPITEEEFYSIMDTFSSKYEIH